MKKLLCLITALSVLSLSACTKANETPLPPSGSPMTTSEAVTSLTGSPEVTELTEPINQSTIIDTENITPTYPIKAESLVLKGAEGGNSLSGLAPLPEISLRAPTASKSFSTKLISHSHGPAANGKPHHTVVGFQDTFDKFGAFTLDRNAKEKVLYLTFDCGYEYEGLTAKVLDVLKEKQVPAAFFCTLDHIEKEREIISRMINEGHIVGNHSATHPSFGKISREKMAKELEETENYLRTNYGYSSKFFRFPAGEYTETALDLVASLGYVSVFWSVAYNDWNVDNIQGKAYATDTVLSRLHDGAIILLHSVSKDNAEALPDIIDEARNRGYSFRALTELA